MAGEMLRRWLPRCENEALGIDAALDSLATKILLDEIIRVQEPKHTPRNCRQ
jgi:hypothetical protein